jgi:RNA polymerase sigma-70 factor (ECF subfamily)
LQFETFDNSYLERLRSGDPGVQEHFVGYFSELMQLKLRSQLRSPQAIEDVRQETFARVLTALRSESGIRQPDRLGAFVNSVCNNVLREYYRSSSRDTPIEEEDDAQVPRDPIDILGVVAARQQEARVRQILEELPEKDRRLLKEVFLEDRDKDDVCRDFGVDRDYLRVLLHRAKQSFKTVYLHRLAARAGRTGTGPAF